MQRMQSNERNRDQLLMKWVQQQIAYYMERGQLVNSLFIMRENNYNDNNNNSNNNYNGNYNNNSHRQWHNNNSHRQWHNNNSHRQWRDIISNGFVLKLFQAIDDKRFSRLLSYEARNYHQLQAKQVIKSYWLALHGYLKQTYNKGISQEFMNEQTNMMNEQTDMMGGKYLLRDMYNNNDGSECQQQQSSSLSSSLTSSLCQCLSIIQLVKVLFYLLVQKENTAGSNGDQQQQQQQQRGQQQQRQQQQLQQYQSLQYQSSSSQCILSNDCNNDDDIDQNDQNDDDNNEQQIINKSKFLARICSLQQQVQQYLVNVIQTIQQQQIITCIQQQTKQTNIQQQPHHHKQQTILQQNGQQPGINHINYNTTNSNQFRRIIFKQLQHLSQENDHLRQRIYLIAQQNQSLQTEIQQNTQQQTIMLNKINDYNIQKQQLFTYLHNENDINITSLEQFVQIVKHIEQQNCLLENTISEIQQRNYQLQQSNAVKVHSINKSAVEITKVNEEIKKFKTKIKCLKDDIQYLDEIVNSENQQNCNQNQNDYVVVNNSPQRQQYQYLNAQMINSINVDDQSQFLFRKSVDSQLRYSLGNVLRENRDIYNQKVFNPISENLSEKRTLTRRSNNPRMSLQNRQKSLRKKNASNYKVYQQNQQNIQPSPFDQEDYIHSDTQNYTSKQSSKLQASQQQQEDEREIECEKQKYRQQLVTSLQQLYKQIADLSGEIASMKQSNKEYQKRSKFNEKKLSQLKSLHQAFLYEAYN